MKIIKWILEKLIYSWKGEEKVLVERLAYILQLSSVFKEKELDK